MSKSFARYAIYLAPPADTPLWRFGSRVLGYDAANGEDLFGFAPAGVTPDDWRANTARPRTYGFHATLKAPFALAAGRTPDELRSELAAFSRARSAFDLGPLAVEAVSAGEGKGFAALIQIRPSQELQALEHDAVRAFDGFRAPSGEEDIRRRKPEALSERQRESLLRYGYPYIGPDYRFHMTLTGACPDAAEIADSLADAMANEIGTAHLKVDALVLFAQAEADARFRILERFPLTPMTVQPTQSAPPASVVTAS